jgi:hypothetical protein
MIISKFVINYYDKLYVFISLNIFYIDFEIYDQ